MFRSVLLKEASKKATTSPVLSPVVIHSLYRRLYREVYLLDRDPIAKILLPLTKELQEVVPQLSTLYVPNGVKYVDVLRKVFAESTDGKHVTVAFNALNRLRVHRENLADKRGIIQKDKAQMLSMLKKQSPEQKKLYRAECLPVRKSDGAPRYVPMTNTVPTRVILRPSSRDVELEEGTVLVAHPLSSTHVDRRVLMITEKNAMVTSAVVLDLQYTYPLSRGNPMFPEVFWGHEVFDGGFSQIGFTMPPTAQIVILHTLSPEGVPSAAEAPSTYRRWLKWGEGEASKEGKELGAAEQHLAFCKPLIRGRTFEDGTVEPTLYLSKTEALPYLASLAPGQLRSSLRVFWGCMRWPTSQIEAEVLNGHWIPLRVSPSFFKAYKVSPHAEEDRFPTADELGETKKTRARRYGADISLPQSFPPDQILRRRECLWDELMFALGGEYTTLVGCSNPFSGLPETSPHILSSTLFLEPPVGQPSEEGAEGWQEAKDAAEPVSTVKPEEDKEASTDNKKSDDVDNEEDKKEK